jgi:hypothetical protein
MFLVLGSDLVIVTIKHHHCMLEVQPEVSSQANAKLLFIHVAHAILHNGRTLCWLRE